MRPVWEDSGITLSARARIMWTSGVAAGGVTTAPSQSLRENMTRTNPSSFPSSIPSKFLPPPHLPSTHKYHGDITSHVSEIALRNPSVIVRHPLRWNQGAAGIGMDRTGAIGPLELQCRRR